MGDAAFETASQSSNRANAGTRDASVTRDAPDASPVPPVPRPPRRRPSDGDASDLEASLETSMTSAKGKHAHFDPHVVDSEPLTAAVTATELELIEHFSTSTASAQHLHDLRQLQAEESLAELRPMYRRNMFIAAAMFLVAGLLWFLLWLPLLAIESLTCSTLGIVACIAAVTQRRAALYTYMGALVLSCGMLIAVLLLTILGTVLVPTTTTEYCDQAGGDVCDQRLPYSAILALVVTVLVCACCISNAYDLHVSAWHARRDANLPAELRYAHDAAAAAGAAADQAAASDRRRRRSRRHAAGDGNSSRGSGTSR